MEKRVVCQRCIHYYVTWEPKRPHGCNAYGFKSKMVPSAVVKNSSGEQCKLFALINNNNRS